LQSEVVTVSSSIQHGGPGLLCMSPQWQGGPVMPPGTGFPFRLVPLAEVRPKYSNPPPHGDWRFSFNIYLKTLELINYSLSNIVAQFM
jgi:hypothetical protein